ncbi:MAG: hypothetical protein VKK62_03030, partial [Synechococcaceae cyanobacterium]|nr:hypothetical protein [Synechococcaceae cyanobacterium]
RRVGENGAPAGRSAMSQSPDASPAGDSRPGDAAAGSTPAEHPHNFDIQKDVHRQIRNDPDYDDWEYGTEPLPHEAWVPGTPRPEGAAVEAPEAS